MSTISSLKIIIPDDWHVHLREGEFLKTDTHKKLIPVNKQRVKFC